jgi:hypothetical protein
MIVTVGLLERTRGDRRGKENDRKWIIWKFSASVYEYNITKFTENC